MTAKVETGETVNLGVSVRSYFMQAACSANRKKCQHFPSNLGGYYLQLLRARAHKGIWKMIISNLDSLDCVSQPERTTTPNQEQVNMPLTPPEICKRSIFHLHGA